jgi:DNA-binding SARP family transcriptional activator
MAFVNWAVLLLLAGGAKHEAMNPAVLTGAPTRSTAGDMRHPSVLGSTERQGTRSYEVRPGDTLWSIAARECGSPLLHKRIAQLNPVTRDPALIRPGWKLALPPQCQLGDYEEYEVRPGDTLWSIAAREYGSPMLWKRVWEANRGRETAPREVFTDPQRIRPGWVLRLPTAIPDLPQGSPAPVRAPSTPTQGPPTGQDARPSPAARPAPEADGARVETRIEEGLQAGPPPASPTPDQARSTPPEGSQSEPGSSVWLRFPEAVAVPVTLASGLLAAASVVILRRRRRRRPDDAPFTVPEGPLLSAARRDGIEPSMDAIGPRALCALGAWSQHSGAVPEILAAWEGEGATDFLLDAEAPLPARQQWERAHDLCPPFTAPAGLEFLSDETGVRARVSAGEVALLQPTGIALADGILVPVGRGSQGALWLPLLGAPLALRGPQAPRLLASMIVAAGLRVDGRELRIIAVGDVGTLVLEGRSDLRDADLPEVERIPEEAEAPTREWLEGELVRRAGLLRNEGVEEIRTHALERPDERLPAVVIVADDRVAHAWGPLLAEASRFGVATVVMGRTAGRVVEVEEGRCQVHDERLGILPDLEACLLPEDVVSELVPTTPEPSPDRSASEPPAPVPPSAPVSVFVLGGFRAERDGEEIGGWCRTRAKEVIAFLAVRGAADNTELLEALWGGSAADTYHAKTLLNYISEARGWLRGMSQMRVVEKVDGRWQLVLDNVWVDVLAFEQALRDADREQSTDPEPALRRALELYRGDFCAGMARRPAPDAADEPGVFSWVTRETERLRCLFVSAVGRLAQILEDGGRAAEALEVTDRGLSEDPLCEALVQKATRLARALEGPGAAAARFRDFERRLAVIGDEPSDETRQLLETSPAEGALRVARG